MGEYARSRVTGERVKIGTCEDLMYLRFDQLASIGVGSEHDTNPRENPAAWRFRFPWPAEDGVAPGEFSEPFKGRAVYGATVPAGVEHGSVQLSSRNGYLLSIPCPEGAGADGKVTLDGRDYRYSVGKNGWHGNLRITGQALRNGNLATICECGGCGAAFNLPTLEHARPILAELEREAAREDAVAERNDTPGNALIAERTREIARRIEYGYTATPAQIADLAGYRAAAEALTATSVDA